MIVTDAAPFAEWIGRTSESEDVVSDRLVESFCATLGPYLTPRQGDQAPLGIHWCLSPAIAPMAALGEDGHPARNLSLPPVPLPRRMWAGGVLEFLAPLPVGAAVRRRSTIADISRKFGKSGDLWFVAVEHDYLAQSGVAIRERQDIVYREAASPNQNKTAAAGAVASIERKAARGVAIEISPTLLFRYSALTFNGHRIHYDYPYATGVEGYSGLVVHGPLQATLLLNLAAAA
ncbi:protein dehydratase, partial [Salmonella enterica subsp. enterica serovar Panama]|nr:protein dehydratase [Salmonella enterica subsp. enterica serovar Panama]